jgi:predicted small metal-binding protein
MKAFACGDVVPGCDATFEGATDDEILAAVAEHARDEHDMDEVPQSVVDAVIAKITFSD